MSNLEQWDDAWPDTEVNEKGKPVPSGTYQAKVTTARMEVSDAGNTMLAWQLTILAGKYKGRILFNYNVIASEKNLKWLKTNLVICGVELAKVSELPTRLGELIGVTLEVAVTKATDKDSGNVWFNKRVDAGASDYNPDSVQDDEVPF